jgi:hypothetical protein
VPARPVDLRGAFVVDLPRGRLEGAQKRVVALGAEAFDTLLARVPIEALTWFGAQLAEAVVTDAKALLDGDEASPEDVAYAFSAALGLRGLGLVRFEQWGHALVLVWRDAPAHSEAFRDVAASVASRVISTLGGSPVEAALVDTRDEELRFLLGTRAVCEHARGRVRAGATWGEVVASLGTSEGA